MTEEIVWWIGVSGNVIGVILMLGLIINNLVWPPFNVAIQRGKLCILGWGLASCTIGGLLYGTFLLDQGTYLRSDGVLSYWSRWAWYIPQNIVLFLAVSKWGWHPKFSITAGCWTICLSSVTALFSVLSTFFAFWVWFGLSLFFCLVWMSLVSITFRRLGYFSYIVLLMIIIPSMIETVITGIGPHLGAIVSLGVEAWVLLIVDLILRIFFFFFLWFTFCPIDIKLIELETLDGYKYKDCKCGKSNRLPFCSLFYHAKNLMYRYGPSDIVSCENHGMCKGTTIRDETCNPRQSYGWNCNNTYNNTVTSPSSSLFTNTHNNPLSI